MGISMSLSERVSLRVWTIVLFWVRLSSLSEYMILNLTMPTSDYEYECECEREYNAEWEYRCENE